MSRQITLTLDEAAALRDIFAALATMEREFRRGDDVIEVSRLLWRDLLTRPAERLHRVAATSRLSEGAESR